MPNTESIKQEIDTSKNEIIELQEIEEFLKSEENIKKLGEAMDSNTFPKLIEEMEKSIKDLCENLLTLNDLTDNQQQILNFFTENFGNKYPEIVEKTELTQIIDECIKTNQISPEKILKINERYNLFGNTMPQKLAGIKEILQNKIKEISQAANEKIAKNQTPNKSPYNEFQVKFIQLWANIFYGANLNINGTRGKNIRNTDNTNEGKTNIYIYKLELTTRNNITALRPKFNSLLSIPNLDAKFNGISQQTQEEIMTRFLNFFLDIKKSGMYFENNIGDENLERVLTQLINAEKYKNTSIEDYYDLYLRFLADDKTSTDEDIAKVEADKNQLISNGYNKMGEYYQDNANQLMQAISESHEKSKDQNSQLIVQNKISRLNSLLNEINKGDSSKKEEFKKIGKELLNNKNLSNEQRKTLLIMLGSAFSEIETNWEKIDITYNGRKCNWLLGQAPHSIVYTPGCNIRVEYDDPEEKYGGPSPTGHMPVNTKIYLDNELLNLSPELNFSRDGYDIHINQNNNLIIKKLGGDGSELTAAFGDEIYNEYKIAQEELNNKARESEEHSDILAQITSNDSMKIRGVTDEDKKTINDETGYSKELADYETAYNLYMRACTHYSAPTPPKQPNYSEYHELKIPGCIGKIVHIKPSERNKLNEIIDEYGEKICFIPTNKENNLIYELTLSDLKLSEKDNEGNIHIFEINNDGSKGNEIKNITSEEIKDVTDVNNIIMSTIQKSPGLMDAMECSMNLESDIKSMQELYKKFDRSNQESLNTNGKRGLTDDDIKELRLKASETATNLKKLCDRHNDFVQLKKGLEERFSGRSNIITEHEKAIKGFITNLDFLIDASLPGGDLSSFCNDMLNSNNAHSNDERYKRLGRRLKTNTLKIIGAIAGGVAAVICAVPTGGCSLLAMAAIMTAGGMVGGFLGHMGHQLFRTLYYNHFGEVEINGQKIQLRYDDPTSLKLAIDGKISRGEYAGELLLQFIIGTATTFGCMYAGQKIGGRISEACVGGKTPKLNNFLKKFNKNFKVENGDPTTDGIFKTLLNKTGQTPQSVIDKFNKRFFYEFIDELGDEVTETGFDELSNAYKGSNAGLKMLFSGLAFFATARHCITPGGNMSKIYRENGISLGDKDGDVDFRDNKQIITLEYSGDLNAIIQYFVDNHYNLVDGHLEMINPDNPAITNVIYLRKTEVSYEARGLASQLSGYGISIDTETGKGYYENIAKIQELELSGKAIVSIDPETKKVTITSGETTLELEQKHSVGDTNNGNSNNKIDTEQETEQETEQGIGQQEDSNEENTTNLTTEETFEELNKIGIYTTLEYLEKFNIQLTEQQLQNIKFLKDAGFSIYGPNIKIIKDMNLTEQQLQNIKFLKDAGISIEVYDIKTIKDMELTEQQLQNIKILIDAGITIYGKDIETTKDMELTEQQLQNIKFLIEIGINISCQNIETINDMNLTEQQLQNIKFLKDAGVSIYCQIIEIIKDMNLTEQQLQNIKFLKDVGVKIFLNDIETVKDINLTEQQLQNIKILIEAGISIEAGDTETIKDINLTEQQLQNIKILIEAGISITCQDIDRVKNLTEQQLENIKNLKETGIYVSRRDIEIVKDINLTEQQLQNIKILTEAGISIEAGDTETVKDMDLTEQQLQNIKILIEAGITIYGQDIETIKDINLTEQQSQNIKFLIDAGIYVFCQDIDTVIDLTEQQLQRIKILKEAGVRIKTKYIETIKDMNLTDQQLQNIKILIEAGIYVFCQDIDTTKDMNLTDQQLQNIKNLKEAGIYIKASDIEIVKDMNLTEQQLQNIKYLIEIGISITCQDIETIKDIKLTEQQLQNIKILKEAGFIIYCQDIETIKDIQLTEQQLQNIKFLINTGVEIFLNDIETIKDIELAEKQIQEFIKIKENLEQIGLYITYQDIDTVMNLTAQQLQNIKFLIDAGIYIEAKDIETVKDINLTEQQLQNIKDLKNAGISSITCQDIDTVKNLTEQQLQNIKKLKEAGFIATITDINLTKEQIQNYIKTRKELKAAGINIFYINTMKELTALQIQNIIKIKKYLIAGNLIDQNVIAIKDIQLTEQQLQNIKNFKNAGFNIEAKDVEIVKDIQLTEQQLQNIKFLIETGFSIEAGDIETIKDLSIEEYINPDTKNFYEGYSYSKNEIKAHQHYKSGRIIENIQSYIQNSITENRKIGVIEILQKFRADIITLPQIEQINIISGIIKSVGKFNTIGKYLDFENGPYKSPKELLCTIRGITDPYIINKITDDITVIQHGIGLMFFVGNPRSYQIISDRSLKDSGEKSGGFNTDESNISELYGTLSVVNGRNPGKDVNSYSYGTIWHEGQHNRNSYFMIDRKNLSGITRAKDEITAYIRDGRSIKEIEQILTKPESEGGLYQYDLEGIARENHKKQVRELLSYANDLIILTKNPNSGLTRENVISMLTDTPVDGRKDLHSNITEAVKLHVERSISETKIVGLREKFVNKIKERAGNSKLIKNIINFWNSLFPDYGIRLDEFWWAGTAKMETVVNEIKNCNSIDEIKHALSDPKYSHIGRGPNNLGGIEISNIIDEVKTGRLSISFVPDEIRPQVEKFIK